jgi:hypothetical protein
MKWGWKKKEITNIHTSYSTLLDARLHQMKKMGLHDEGIRKISFIRYYF